jgi:hypothetical protein
MNNSNTNILFIGGYYPKALEHLFLKKRKQVSIFQHIIYKKQFSRDLIRIN